MKEKHFTCHECEGPINTNKGLIAKLHGRPKCPLGFKTNPLTEEATNNLKTAGGFASICNKNPWKYK